MDAKIRLVQTKAVVSMSYGSRKKNIEMNKALTCEICGDGYIHQI